MCITVLTTARQLQLSWSRSFQCTASHHIYLKLVLTLSHHSCRSIPNKLYISYQLNAQISLFISFYSPLHVSSSIMLILRRSNCMYTAYGIITLYKWPCWSYITQVEREQRNFCIKLVNGIKFIFSCVLSGCTIVFHIISQSTQFSKKNVTEQKTRVWISSTTVVWNIFHSKEN